MATHRQRRAGYLRLEERIDADLAREKRQAREAALVFARACAGRDVKKFFSAVHAVNDTIGGWTIAMRHIAKMSSVDPKMRTAFETVWIMKKDLGLEVGRTPTFSKALKVLLARPEIGPLTIYRGANGMEHAKRAYGFSWSTRIEVARSFAKREERTRRGGVIFRSLAPSEAILWQRPSTETFDEGEVVVDPYRLRRVSVIERFSVAK